MKKIFKIMHRVRRIIGLKKGIYCKFGIENIFGKNCFIDENTSLGMYNFIGRNTSITKAEIGNYCSIAPNVVIGPGEHNYKEVSTNQRVLKALNLNYNLTSKDVVIKNDVWIGTKAIILRGVQVGDGVVIGAGSIVTKDIPNYAIVVGIPAKVIGYRFDKKKIIELEKSKWWESKLDDAIIKLNNVK